MPKVVGSGHRRSGLGLLCVVPEVPSSPDASRVICLRFGCFGATGVPWLGITLLFDPLLGLGEGVFSSSIRLLDV